MADINQVVLVGRLTRDAELKYTAGGQAVCKFSIAVNRRKKVGDQWEDEVNYFDVVLWGRQGESINQFMQKGKQIGVEGELRQDRWQQDGQNRSKIEIIASNVQLLGGSPGAGQGAGQGGNFTGNNSGGQDQGYSGNRGQPAPAQDDGFTDDIPF
ncbi:MAG: single-stranded DNA-binding protein [Treponema sp.]|nr:single-stranded DNA-binding protein [Treponema sp.]